MMDGVEKFSITRFSKDEKEEIEEMVAGEYPLTIIMNNQELVTLPCSSDELKYLAVGFLASEGFIKSKDEIKKVLVDTRRGIVRVETAGEQAPLEDMTFKRFITTGCGRGATFYNAADAQEEIRIDSQTTLSVTDVLSLAKAFLQYSQTYKTTGGVHSAALCDRANILMFAEDIGRHNALDKIFGQCFLESIPTEDTLIVSSGRISSEMLLKVAKRLVPVVISKSAPTALAVRLAEKLGITLVGFVRGKRMNVYTHDWRIKN